MHINYEQVLQISKRIEQQMGVRDLFVEEVTMKMTAVKPPVVVKSRKNLPEVRFAVGMVMRHRKFKYTCVIYGWDEKCAESSDWIEQVAYTRIMQHRDKSYLSLILILRWVLNFCLKAKTNHFTGCF